MDRCDSDWETVSETEDTPGIPSDSQSNQSRKWYQNVHSAIERCSTSDLEELIQQPSTGREDILNYAEEMITAVGRCVSTTALSPDFEAVLQMLMYIIVEYGSAAELVLFFTNFFHKADHPYAAEVEFLIPNMQGTLLRLKKFRLFWLSSILAQIDYFAADLDWNNVSPEDSPTHYDELIHLQSLVCDFVQPFVEDVRLYRDVYHIPEEKNYSTDRALRTYRECLGRSLLHLLSDPLGVYPVSYAKGFASYRRIVGLLAKVVPDFTIFPKWSDKDQTVQEKFQYEEGSEELMRIPINTSSLTKLAFLVRSCDIVSEPYLYPSPLTANYFVNSLMLPYFDYPGIHTFREQMNFLLSLLDEIPENSWSIDDIDENLFEVVSHLLSDAGGNPSEKARRRVYAVADRFFTRMNRGCLLCFVGELWNQRTFSEKHNLMEVLVVSLKRPVISQLTLLVWESDSWVFLTKEQFLSLFSGLLRVRRNGPLADSTGLVASIMGLLTMVIGMDKENRTGVKECVKVIERFLGYWKDELKEYEKEVKQQLWMEREDLRLSGSEGPSGEISVEQAEEVAQSHLTWSGVLTMAFESLETRLNGVRVHNGDVSCDP